MKMHACRERARKTAPVIYILHQLIAVLITFNHRLLRCQSRVIQSESNCEWQNKLTVCGMYNCTCNWFSSPIDLCKLNCGTSVTNAGEYTHELHWQTINVCEEMHWDIHRHTHIHNQIEQTSVFFQWMWLICVLSL